MSKKTDTGRKATTSHSTKSRGDGPAPAGPEAMGEIGETLATWAQTWNTECARFVSRRMERHMEHYRTLLGCRDPMQVIDAQSRFAQHMAEDYMEESQAMVDIATQASRQGMDLLGSTTQHLTESAAQAATHAAAGTAKSAKSAETGRTGGETKS